MAMQRQTWTINGLSAEFGVDRRTLSKRLSGLPPAEIKELKNRTERRWYLSDVLSHLERRDSQADGIEAEALAEFKRIIAENLYPSIITSNAFGAIISNGLQDELGLTEAQGRRAYELACAALVYALCEVLEDDDLQFQLPDFIMDKPPA